MKKLIKILLLAITLMVVAVIAIYAAAYYAIAQGWTDVEGEVDGNSQHYQKHYEQSLGWDNKKIYGPIDTRTQRSKLLDCQIKYLSGLYPGNGEKIQKTLSTTGSEMTASRMIFAASLRDEGLKGRLWQCNLAEAPREPRSADLFSWINTEEWPIIKEAITKDRELILRASDEAGIDARLLMMPLAVEQLRLYFSQREFYEKFFKPLKILVSTNQMAWGVMAIKERSAEKIENNLKDPGSPFYPGPEYEHLLDLTTENALAERSARLNNDKEHYWSYLYGALYIKELMTQWQRSGYPIDSRPELIATLYNLGFERSKPKADPEVGGSTIDIAGDKYTFGALGFEIYYSGEMMSEFPYAN